MQALLAFGHPPNFAQPVSLEDIFAPPKLKVEMLRLALLVPQLGHIISSSFSEILRNSVKLWLHLLQEYSNKGIQIS